MSHIEYMLKMECDNHTPIYEDGMSVIDLYESFLKNLRIILDRTVGVKQKRKFWRKPVPWWTKECSRIIKERKD